MIDWSWSLRFSKQIGQIGVSGHTVGRVTKNDYFEEVLTIYEWLCSIECNICVLI